MSGNYHKLNECGEIIRKDEIAKPINPSLSELVLRLSADMESLKADTQQIKHNTDFANGAIPHIWQGIVQKYANWLKAKPKRAIFYTAIAVYIIHPYVFAFIMDFYNKHIHSAIWTGMAKSLGLL